MKTTIYTLLTSLLLMLVNRFEATAQCYNYSCTTGPSAILASSTVTQTNTANADWNSPNNLKAGGSTNFQSTTVIDLINILGKSSEAITIDHLGFNVAAGRVICSASLTVTRQRVVVTHILSVVIGDNVSDAYVGVTGGANLAAGGNWPTTAAAHTYTLGALTPAAVNSTAFGITLQANAGALTLVNAEVYGYISGISLSLLLRDSTITPCPLPVELTSFTGTQEGSCTRLNWHTATEADNDYFIIEKLFGGNFVEIGRVKSLRGSTTTPSDYELVDCNTSATNYYRLIQVDNNGHREEMGDVVTVSVNPEHVDKIMLIPNPANEYVCVTAEHPIKTIRVISPDGKVVYDQAPADDYAKQSCISLADFDQGVYTVQVETTLGTFSKRLVVQ